MNNNADSTPYIYERCELIEVMCPKSGLNPEINLIPNESAINQASSDLISFCFRR